MRRREFLGVLAGVGAVWPFAVLAQDRMRRIGVLMNLSADNPEASARRAAFVKALQQLGWTDGVNVRIDYRWAGNDAVQLRKFAAELIAFAPDVIMATASITVGALQNATRSVPIVFARVADPVGAGFVESLNRPGGNITGFSLFEYGISAKWLELLKEIAPNVTRAAVLRDPSNASGIGQFAAIQAVAPSFRVILHPIDVRNASAIERDIAVFAREPNGGLIVTSATQAVVHHELIVALSARHRLPAVHGTTEFAKGGALISYGPDMLHDFQRAAGYVDRILRGEKPADLPVQAPTKYELVINLKTAKILGLTVPPSLLARADEVIE